MIMHYTNVIRALAIKGITAKLCSGIAAIDMNPYAKDELFTEVAMIENIIASLMNSSFYLDEHIANFINASSIDNLCDIIEGNVE